MNTVAYFSVDTGSVEGKLIDERLQRTYISRPARCDEHLWVLRTHLQPMLFVLPQLV
jgi:hypothetical protein